MTERTPTDEQRQRAKQAFQATAALIWHDLRYGDKKGVLGPLILEVERPVSDLLKEAVDLALTNRHFVTSSEFLQKVENVEQQVKSERQRLASIETEHALRNRNYRRDETLFGPWHETSAHLYLKAAAIIGEAALNNDPRVGLDKLRALFTQHPWGRDSVRFIKGMSACASNEQHL